MNPDVVVAYTPLAAGVKLYHVEKLEPPANDDFADAQAVDVLPSSQKRTSRPPVTRKANRHRAAALPRAPRSAYTGDSLSSLMELSCGGFTTFFHADAGTPPTT